MNIFDIIGPIMIGPSSSHTAGAVRIGRVARKILGEEPATAKIELHGSFAMTYKGHGTDKALIAGILGMKPDDERIIHSIALAREKNLHFTFHQIKLPEAHPNTAVLTLTGINGATCVVEGASIGGGNIQITKLNGMAAAFSGGKDTLIVAHHDRPGVIAAVTDKLAQLDINIGSFKLSRPKKSQLAIMTIELDSEVESLVITELKNLANIVSVTYMHPAS